jgi:hypothetical protein
MSKRALGLAACLSFRPNFIDGRGGAFLYYDAVVFASLPLDGGVVACALRFCVSLSRSEECPPLLITPNCSEFPR